jgi:hypothetical protein
MAILFEVSASVMLVGKSLQFVGVAGTRRVRFLISNDALKQISGSTEELTRQQKFKAFDRHREWFQEIARRLYELAPTPPKTIKITLADVLG